MSEWLREIRLAIRSLRRNRGFAATVILTLALGIGGNTAILAAVRVIFFAPLPFPHSDRLVRLRSTTTHPSGDQNAVNLHGSEVLALEQQGAASPFSSLVSLDVEERTLTGGEVPERISVVGCHGHWNSVLEVRPVVGGWFSADEERRGSQSGVAVISSSLWSRHFGREPNAIGKSIDLDNRTFVVIGVMPEGFRFPYTAEVWTPTDVALQGPDDYAVFGRLKDGVSIAAASQALAVVSKELLQQYPNLYSIGVGFKLWPIRASFVEDQQRGAIALTAVGGFFLLLASFNVASLLLARSVTRRNEQQIRAALGAGRWQLMRQSLAETTILSLAGGVLGVALAAGSGTLLSSLIPAVFTRELNMSVAGIGWFSVTVAVVLSLLIAVVAGLLPAVSNAAISPVGVVRSSTRTSRSRRERLWMDGFVALEFTLALSLIAGAGLMLRNFRLLTHRDLGIDTTHLLAIHVSTTGQQFDSPAAKRALVDGLVRAAESTPGVAAAGVSTVNPLGGTTWSSPIEIEGHEMADATTSYVVNHRLITPHTLEAMGIRLLQGRDITEQDREDTPGVALVSQRMARKYWPNGDALGKRLRVNRPGQPWLTVVGIVSDVSDWTYPSSPRETWYLPYAQNAGTPAASDVILMVRSVGDPRSVDAAVERNIHAEYNDLALYDSAAMNRFYLETLSQQRLVSIMISLIAGFGLLLGSLGIYGTISFAVGERVREIGIRMALGADRSEILRLIMTQGLRLTLLGGALGFAASWALARVLSRLLSEVSPHDPLTYVAATALLFIVASFAIYLPARRASGVDPILALRQD